MPVEDGTIGHGEIRVGDTVVLAFDLRPDWPAMPSLLRVYVPDADAAMAASVRHGAQVVTEAADSAWGDRGGRVRDPFGNIWWVMSRVEDVEPDRVWERASSAPQHPAGRESGPAFPGRRRLRARGASRRGCAQAPAGRPPPGARRIGHRVGPPPGSWTSPSTVKPKCP